MLKLWGRTSSINVQKALWCLKETGIAFEQTEVGGKFGGVDTPEYKAMNPNSRVPTIVDDGFVLWESNAIVRYVSEKYASGTLWPTDRRVRADADRWMDWQATMFNPAMHSGFWGLIRTPKEQQDAAAIQRSLDDTAKMMAILDAQLADRRFITGDTFTMGDIPIGCGVHRWLNLPAERPARPNIERWYGELMQRPAVKGVLTTPIT